MRTTALPTRSPAGRRFGAIVLVAISGLLAACAMSQSTLVSPKDAVGCRSSAGAYNLSKSYIAFDIHKEPTGIGTAQGYFLRVPGAPQSGIAVMVKPDPQYTYCLDYLASATSNDTFKVEKDKHILKKISSKADDQSAVIASTLIKTLFVGLSENPNFDQTRTMARSLGRATLGGTLVFSGVIDPFDHDDVNRINDSIRDFGYCLFLEGEPVDPGHDDVDAYCENPIAWARNRSRRITGLHGVPQKASNAPKTIDRAGQDVAPRNYAQGVFYRPRIGVTYYLYVKENLKLRGVRGAWKMRATATAFLENAAPVFSVGVDRTFFATRETTLDFDQGVLKDVTISKTSEVAGFVTIPLQVAQSVVALPANIIQVKINLTNNNAALVIAQDALVNAKINLANSQRTLAATPVPGATPGGGQRSLGDVSGPQSFAANGGYAQCMSPCLSRGPGNSEPACSRYCTCKVNLCAGKGDDLACENSCRTYLDQ